MTFSHQIRGSMAQVLETVSEEKVRTFLFKHANVSDSRLRPIGSILRDASPEALRSMLAEILGKNGILRQGATGKHVFDNAVRDLECWALYDGWSIKDGLLVRVTPLAEEVTGVQDKLMEDLRTSGLDRDGEITKTLKDSAKDFVAAVPDFNGSVTKVRIALETIARRGAASTAAKRSVQAPDDKWGPALQFLRAQAIIEKQDEDILAQIYTFTSPAAHVPKGITEEEWARLARTFAVSSAYFVLRKILNA
jgi:hypothetical protein